MSSKVVQAFISPGECIVLGLRDGVLDQAVLHNAGMLCRRPDLRWSAFVAADYADRKMEELALACPGIAFIGRQVSSGSRTRSYSPCQDSLGLPGDNAPWRPTERHPEGGFIARVSPEDGIPGAEGKIIVWARRPVGVEPVGVHLEGGAIDDSDIIPVTAWLPLGPYPYLAPVRDPSLYQGPGGKKVSGMEEEELRHALCHALDTIAMMKEPLSALAEARAQFSQGMLHPFDPDAEMITQPASPPEHQVNGVPVASMDIQALRLALCQAYDLLEESDCQVSRAMEMIRDWRTEDPSPPRPRRPL